MRRMPRHRIQPAFLRFAQRRRRENVTAPAPAAVSVPVLSNTTASTRASVSSTYGFFRKTLRRASTRCAVPKANGAASASAHGHATISTDVNAFSAIAGFTKAQNAAAPTAITITSLVNRWLYVLVSD